MELTLQDGLIGSSMKHDMSHIKETKIVRTLVDLGDTELRACRAQTIGDAHVPVTSRFAFPPTLRHIGVTLSRYAYDNGSTNDEDFAYRFPAGTDFNNEIRAGSGDGSY
jgi:hypothetical protein